jgi:Molybdopterin cofactor-binding domain
VAEQVRGGVVQGIGSALYEHIVYDAHGQLQTRTLMDYLVPGSAEMPDIEVYHIETPSPFTGGGFKGVGEAGTTGAPAAIVNAVNDALAPLGVRLTRQPITPDLILGALRAARRRSSGGLGRPSDSPLDCAGYPRQRRVAPPRGWALGALRDAVSYRPRTGVRHSDGGAVVTARAAWGPSTTTAGPTARRR